MTSLDRSRFGFSREERLVAEDIRRIGAGASTAGRKLIYCSFGAYFMGDDIEFWQRLIAAARTRPDWNFVLGLGGRLDPRALGALPKNVHAFSWAPQMLALEHADAAVIHGGMTTVYECIHSGVPMLSYPFAAIFDQLGTAARVRYRGLGIIGDSVRDTPADIVRHIERLFSDVDIRNRIATMRETMRRYVQEDRLAEAVSCIIAKEQSARTIASAPAPLADLRK